jgi:hypothetical protein
MNNKLYTRHIRILRKLLDKATTVEEVQMIMEEAKDLVAIRLSQIK